MYRWPVAVHLMRCVPTCLFLASPMASFSMSILRFSRFSCSRFSRCSASALAAASASMAALIMADCELWYDASGTAARDEEDEDPMGPEGSGVAREGARSTLRLHTWGHKSTRGHDTWGELAASVEPTHAAAKPS